MNRSQLVSIIITTKNEEDVIGKLLMSIDKQSYKSKEVILVDNNSDDQTVKIAKEMGVKVLNFGPERSAQRNFGARIAKGNYFLFLDADMELSKNVLRECVDVCKRWDNIGAVVIPEKSQGKGFWEKVKTFERSFYNKEGDEMTDAARFFKRQAFVSVGGYDEEITGPEDWDLPENVKKSGFKIGRIKSLIYHYERINSPLDLARKKFYYALRSHRYLSKQNISVIGPKTIYFLRPVFYRSWKRLLGHPVLTLAMYLMFTLELLGGGLGYIIGRIRK